MSLASVGRARPRNCVRLTMQESVFQGAMLSIGLPIRHPRRLRDDKFVVTFVACARESAVLVLGEARRDSNSRGAPVMRADEIDTAIRAEIPGVFCSEPSRGKRIAFRCVSRMIRIGPGRVGYP